MNVNGQQFNIGQLINFLHMFANFMRMRQQNNEDEPESGQVNHQESDE